LISSVSPEDEDNCEETSWDDVLGSIVEAAARVYKETHNNTNSRRWFRVSFLVPFDSAVVHGAPCFVGRKYS
jgi:hypothetical protein